MNYFTEFQSYVTLWDTRQHAKRVGGKQCAGTDRYIHAWIYKQAKLHDQYS